MKRKQRCDCGKFMRKKKVAKLTGKGNDDKYAITFACIYCGALQILNFLKITFRNGSYRWEAA